MCCGKPSSPGCPDGWIGGIKKHWRRRRWRSATLIATAAAAGAATLQHQQHLRNGFPRVLICPIVLGGGKSAPFDLALCDRRDFDFPGSAKENTTREKRT